MADRRNPPNDGKEKNGKRHPKYKNIDKDIKTKVREAKSRR